MKKAKRTKPEPAPAKPYEWLYQLKIHLLDTKLYSRFVVRGDTTVVQLHHIVQLVMGWDNWHLHYFQIFGHQYEM